MTGQYETELAAIVNAPAWGIPNIDQLGKALDHLVDNLTVLVASPGGKGNWATSASDSFAALQKKYFAARLALPAIDGAIANANNAKSAARDAYGRLPGISIPDDVKFAVAAAAVGTAIAVPILGPTPIAAALVLGMVEGMFGNQREAQAKAALDTLQKDLSTPAGTLAASNQAIAATPVKKFDGSGTQKPTDGGSQSGSGTATSRPSPAAKRYYAGAGSAGSGDSGAGQGFAPGDPGPSVGGESGSGGAGHSSTSADGDLSGGTVPGTGYNGGIGLAGSGGGLGAEGLRGLGIGAGSAASAAAVAAAARMGGLGNLGSGSLGGGGLGGGGLGGGAGGGLRVGGLGAAAGKGGSGGTGGLLGSGAKATVAASSAEEGAGGAAGSKSGNSMMGGQGGGAAGREKEKRSGLGGLMAPKLEDDEELGPRSAGARAGGRSGGRDAAGE